MGAQHEPVSVSGAIDWYSAKVRSVLLEHLPSRVDEFDVQAKSLSHLEAVQDQPIPVCFLGQSQIGKSTLINALVAGGMIVLPAGGVGPLTAQAIQVQYSDQPFFEVEYQPKKIVWNLAFALERHLERLRQASAANDVVIGLNDDDREDVLAIVESDGQTQVITTFEHQAKLLVTGDQHSDVDLAYLVDCLRAACGLAVRWGSTASQEDQVRVAHLQQILAGGSSSQLHRAHGSLTDSGFMKDLNDHSAGFLAPLILSLKLGWPSKLLQSGLVLVDLPGVGVADDAHRAVTDNWIGQKARTVCLVVSNAGVDAASADLLRSSRFLNRLLHSSDDPAADPVQLCVIAVRMDSLADSKYYQERQNLGNGARKRTEHLKEVCEKMPALIKAQLQEQLHRIADDAEGPARDALIRAANNTIANLQIFPVSALEYFKLLNEDGNFIKTEEQSGIPGLQRALDKMASDRAAIINQALRARMESFSLHVRSVLQSLREQWSDDTIAEQEAERIRGLLQPFIDPKKRELYARQGAFNAFLKKDVPQRITSLVSESSHAAEKAMVRYVRVLEDAHWATLKAVVRKGGAFHGARKIDLPYELAVRFETQVAPVWSEHIIKAVRENTKELADSYVGIVEEVVEWAESNGARTQARAIDAMAKQIKEDGKRLATVGKDGAESLREQVKAQLMKGITEPIRKRCQKFVADGYSTGRGVKNRILTLLKDDLIPMVVDSAARPTAAIMQSSFQLVESEIRECLEKHSDPVKTAEEVLVTSHLDSEKRSKAQKRKKVLADIGFALAEDQQNAASV